MKSLNILYTSFEQLLSCIDKEEIDKSKQCFVRINASCNNADMCLDLAKNIKGLMPKAVISGQSVSGVVFNGEIFEDEILITITQFHNSKIETKLIKLDDKQLDQTVNELSLYDDESKKAIAFIFFASFYLHIGDIVKTLAKKYPNVTFVGGNAAYIDNDEQISHFVFNDEELLHSGVIITYVSSERILTYSNTVVGHDPIGKTYEITGVNNEYITEIENKPAAQWYYEKLNMKEDTTKAASDKEEYISSLLSYPIVLEDNDGASRFVRGVKNSGKLKLYNSYTQKGQKFKIGYLSPLKSAEEWQNIFFDLQNFPAQDVYCYSCIMRKNILNNLSKWEIKSFAKAQICGAFLHGEIGQRNLRGNFFEGSCSFFTMAEEQSYIRPDYDNFNDISDLNEVSDKLINQLSEDAHAIDETQTKEKTQFVDAVKIRDSEMKNKMMLSDYLNVLGMAQFFKDQTKSKNKKLCLIKISCNNEQNAASGIEQAKAVTKQVLGKIKTILENYEIDLCCKFYSYDLTSFFFTSENNVKQAHFVDATQYIYKQLKKETEENTFNSYNLDIAVTISGAYVVQLYNQINKQSKNDDSVNFTVFHDDEDTDALKQEFKMVASINHAIKNNLIVPYFQGIYDNRKNRFYCFESLMRLIDETGNILLPKDFMEISKKYNLYSQLSLCMVLKILSMFENRSEVISVNISAIDVLSPDFCNTLFEKLDSMENTDHFIFELVETEKFENYSDFRGFIHKLKQYGVKIAIDDFGSGYSNFIEIGNLQIDFIKIDGTLTSLLGTDSSYEQILQSIHFLSTKLGVQLIAEYVETAAMQKSVVKNGVRFSQGYFFSKPMPIEELNIVSRDNPQDTLGDKNEQDEEIRRVLKESKGAKNKSRLVFFGGAIVTCLVSIAIILFANYSRREVQNINDSFLTEIATNMSDKVSTVMDDSAVLLTTVKNAVTAHSYQKEEIAAELQTFDNQLSFDDIFIQDEDGVIIDSYGKELDIDLQFNSVETKNNEVIILSPMTDGATDKEFFLIATSIYDGNKKVANLYGKYNLDSFSQLLNIRSFGGQAFFHLCEVGGQPLILSGNTNNLFTGGDMYDFIGSLDIKNGHTQSSLRENMEKGETTLLKYIVNNEERTAVMARVPNTPWVIVSIVQNQVAINMLQDIQEATIIFSLVLAVIFLIYFTSMNFIANNIQNDLVKALENSKLLSNSLQTSVETDILTRTYSRATITEKITDEINRAKQLNLVHAMLIIDVDNFKAINDTYGHQTGDLYLQELVSAVKSSLRAGDIIGRLGGDEFAVMLCNVGSIQNTKNALERIFDKVKSITIKEVELDNVGLSAGVVMVPSHGDTYQDLNLKADKALYKAKNAGKNRWMIHEEK